jgi:hypothetical protein
MKFFEFIFLKRKLEQDKDNIIYNLQMAKKRGRPMWLVLFPEGTGTWKHKRGVPSNRINVCWQLYLIFRDRNLKNSQPSFTWYLLLHKAKRR